MPLQSGISTFARLSGCVNADITRQRLQNEDFQRLLPYHICISSELLPCIDMEKVRNAYALDFFKHGNVTALSEDNGLRDGDIFHYLNDFLLTIKTISTALEQTAEHEVVTEAFKHLAVVFELRYRKSFPWARIGC